MRFEYIDRFELPVAVYDCTAAGQRRATAPFIMTHDMLKFINDNAD